MNDSPPPPMPMIGDARTGWAVACSRRGAAHAHGGQPCQDAALLQAGAVAGAPFLIVAIADGHGAAKHDRSQHGAALAVRAAVDEAAQLVAQFAAVDSAALKRAFRADIPRRVGARWRRAVEEHAASSGDEGDEGRYSRYGTTLLLALVTADSLLVGQIGDGEALLVRPGGAAVERLLPQPEGLLGTATHSLATEAAPTLWRTTVMARGAGGLLLLATDGLSDAFAAEEEFLRFAASLHERLDEYGVGGVTAALPQWLDHYSAQASGDDITLALAMLHPAPDAGHA